METSISKGKSSQLSNHGFQNFIEIYQIEIHPIHFTLFKRIACWQIVLEKSHKSQVWSFWFWHFSSRRTNFGASFISIDDNIRNIWMMSRWVIITFCRIKVLTKFFLFKKFTIQPMLPRFFKTKFLASADKLIFKGTLWFETNRFQIYWFQESIKNCMRESRVAGLLFILNKGLSRCCWNLIKT